MTLKIEKAKEIGFCFGVRRAIDIVERAVREHGSVETLGALVHNEQVLKNLSEMGVKLVRSIEEIQGKVVAISSHGVSPEVEARLRERHVEIIDTTCPFVRRAHIAARRLRKSGFFVVIYGDAAHPEVKGILGWAENKGLATLDEKAITQSQDLPRHLGILSQTTQIPELFTRFAGNVVASRLTRDTEIRIIDTICHDIRKRQDAAKELAERVDLMLVIGGHSSSNTKRLAELCSTLAETYLIETAGEIRLPMLEGKRSIGVTSGASTAEQTIEEVVAKLKAFLGKKS